MLKKILPALLAMFLMHSAAAAGDEPVATAFLDGRWEGALTDLAPLPGRSAETSMRLHIQGKTAHVFVQQDDGKWIEAKPGKFSALQNNFSAVVFASDSSRGNCWDETWTFAMALDGGNQLLTKYSRVVSNVRCMRANAETFGRQASGSLSLQQSGTSDAAH